MSIIRLCLLVALATLLAGCGGRPPANGGGDVTGGISYGGDDAIRWEQDASKPIFKIDVVGGDESFTDRNNIPLCAVYGDNRVVWLDTTEPNRTIVLFDALEDLEIFNFITALTVNKRLFTYTGETELRYEAGNRPVYEEIVLNVNDTRHVTDGFNNWPDGYFREVLDLCTSLSNTPALYEPTAGWLSASSTDYDNNATIIYWNPDGAGVDLSLLADDGRIWVDNPVIVRRLWQTMTNSPTYRLFSQGTQYYQVAFEVPNVHPSAPPAPAPNELEQARQLPSDRDTPLADN